MDIDSFTITQPDNYHFSIKLIMTYNQLVAILYRLFSVAVAVVVAFVICWAPFHAQRLMTIYVAHWTDALLEIQSLLFYISGLCQTSYKQVGRKANVGLRQ